MQNVTETIKAFLEENRYKILEIEDDSITIIFEMNTMIINPDSSGRNFVSVVLPSIEVCENDEDLLAAYKTCSKVSETQMVTKGFITDMNVNLAYEFNYLDEADMLYNINRAFDALIFTKLYYRRTKATIE